MSDGFSFRFWTEYPMSAWSLAVVGVNPVDVVFERVGDTASITPFGPGHDEQGHQIRAAHPSVEAGFYDASSVVAIETQDRITLITARSNLMRRADVVRQILDRGIRGDGHSLGDLKARVDGREHGYAEITRAVITAAPFVDHAPYASYGSRERRVADLRQAINVLRDLTLSEIIGACDATSTGRDPDTDFHIRPTEGITDAQIAAVYLDLPRLARITEDQEP